MKTPFGQRKKRVAFTRIVKRHIQEVHPLGQQAEKIRLVLKLGPYKHQYMRVNERMWHRSMHNYITTHLGFRHLKDVKVPRSATYIKLYENILPLNIATWKTIESSLLAYREEGQETPRIKECFAVLNNAFLAEAVDTESAREIEIEETVLQA